MARFGACRHCCFKQSDPDPCIHDHYEGQRSQVNVGKQDGGVDLSHLLVRPIFPAPVERASSVSISQEHSDALFFSHLKHDTRGAHDGHCQDPYYHDDKGGC